MSEIVLRVVAAAAGALGLRALIAGFMEADPFQGIPGIAALAAAVGLWRRKPVAMLCVALFCGALAYGEVTEAFFVDVPPIGGRVRTAFERNRALVWHAGSAIGYGAIALFLAVGGARAGRVPAGSAASAARTPPAD